MNLRIALVHDWLIHRRGGEKVLEAFYEIFPRADIYTLFYDRKQLPPRLKKARVRASFLQLFPFIRHYYRWLLPLFPFAVRSLRLQDYDLVISSSHCVAKGCRVPKGAFHLSYCHTPARYLWGFREEYFGSLPFLVRKGIQGILDRLQQWDLKTSGEVSLFVANSLNTKRRIQQFYGREAGVVYPPIDTETFQREKGAPAGDYFLLVSALVPYKRVDLAIEAFNRLGYPLLVIGDGPDREKLRKKAGPSIQFLGNVEARELRDRYAHCRALVFPGEEDFGMALVEVQACGRPVIAYGKGGALESVSEKTGVLFDQQEPESLIGAVREFERRTFDPEVLQAQAQRFDRRIFREKIEAIVESIRSQQPRPSPKEERMASGLLVGGPSRR